MCFLRLGAALGARGSVHRNLGPAFGTRFVIVALLMVPSVLQGRNALLLQRDQLLYSQVQVGQSLLPAALNPEILCGAAAESQGDGVELWLGDGAIFAIFFQSEEFLIEALTLGLKLRYYLKRVYSLARVSVLEKRNSRYS